MTCFRSAPATQHFPLQLGQFFNEPTTGLDAVTESSLGETIEPLVGGRMTLIVAHRLSTSERAGCSLVLEDGRIVEQGKHEDLLASGGLYSELYQAQIGEEPEEKQPA